MNAANALFDLQGGAVRLLYRLSGARPASSPYLSGDGFRSLCRLYYEGDNRHLFQTAWLHAGEAIFVEAWHLEEFLKGPARRIPCPFSIISHNGDRNIDESFMPLLPPKLVRLFAQNVLVRDHRIIALPIGLENRRLHCNGIVRDFRAIRRRQPGKRPRVLSAFTVGTNPLIRKQAMAHLARSRVNDTIPRMKLEELP